MNLKTIEKVLIEMTKDEAEELAQFLAEVPADSYPSATADELYDLLDDNGYDVEKDENQDD